MLQPHAAPLTRIARVTPLAVLALAAPPSAAQEVPPGAVSENPVPDFVAALSFLSLDESITGASLTVFNDDPTVEDTEFSTLKFPWEHDFDVGSDAGTLFVEASVGYLRGRDRASAVTPLGEVTVDQDWHLYAGKLGLGWTFPLGETWRLRPSLGLALSHIENDASYNELGEELLAPLLDGVLVNWDAWSLTTAGSLTALHERELGAVELTARARYTYAWTDVFDATDPFQEQSDASEFVSARVDLEGPTPLQAWQRPVNWKVFGSFATFLDSNEDALGFDYVFEVGLGLRIPLPKLVDDVLLSGAVLLGEDLTGSTYGLSVSF